uniref:Uncharacterized protein n=1 Tax=Knipowitschia caucasica TaxID=637954 RepID=A0AAV2LHJ6_KNICA
MKRPPSISDRSRFSTRPPLAAPLCGSPVESDRDDLSVAGVQPFIEEKELEVLEKRHSDLWLNEKRANNLEDNVIEFDEDLASDPLDSEYIVLNRRWLKDVEKFLTFRTTSQLESFQNHILIISSRWNRDRVC